MEILQQDKIPAEEYLYGVYPYICIPTVVIDNARSSCCSSYYPGVVSRGATVGSRYWRLEHRKGLRELATVNTSRAILSLV